MKDKKALAVILAKKMAPKGPVGSMGPMEDDEETGDEGKMAAAEELIAALKDGDAQRLVYAFEDLKAMCD